MNHALETDLIWGFPSLFSKDAEVDIGVGWLSLVEEMLVELGSCNLKISSITEEVILGTTSLGITIPVSLVVEDVQIIEILQKYVEESKHTCSISGETITPLGVLT